ncbi:C40 family peptidase [Carbonactinospora thermoautotrophica]|uniref:C40 family peptidase n=1 Tax=Carbonactinospora thermoautotrophica TaxID=1469144 RepID=UPI00082A2245|nr:NlpC/P60 family protein [Carbonactinospora thermoautotrophica]
MGGAQRAVVAAAGVTAFVLGIVLLVGMGSQPASGVGLRPGTVPAAYLSWVLKAGSLCPQVSAPLIAAQIEAESGWRPGAVSPAGARGIAQFMPGTWPHWGRDDDGNGRVSPHDPGDAIMAMGRYDCALARQVASVPGDPTANMLAAYNAGPGAVLLYGGVPPFAETQSYVQRIKRLIPTYAQVEPGPGGSATSFGAAVVAAAERWIDTPYVWGGGDYDGPTGSPVAGFDCSGLVLYAVYQASGGRIRLPHLANLQARLGTAVSPDQLRPGDVIAFARPGSRIYHHIGIYAGNGQMIHAPYPGARVRVESLNSSSWHSMTWSIRRFG